MKGPCLQRLVTWFEFKKLINSRIVGMNNQFKFQKSHHSDLHMARVN